MVGAEERGVLAADVVVMEALRFVLVACSSGAGSWPAAVLIDSSRGGPPGSLAMITTSFSLCSQAVA